MADVANAVVVSKDLSDLSNNSVSSECSDTNIPKPQTQTTFPEIDSFSDLSFRTGDDDISLQDIIESEFAARMSGISTETSPSDERRCGLDELDVIQDFLDSERKHAVESCDGFDLRNLKETNDGERMDEMVRSASPPGDGELGPNPDVVCDNDTPTAQPQPDLVAFKCPRPSEMPIICTFDPFARFEEDSDHSNSNPVSSSNVLNSPDEFSFPGSPQDGQTTSEPMVDLFVKAISEENIDLSESVQNDFSKFNTSSVESVNNSCPIMSNLTSPDRADHDEILSDDLISSEPVDTVVDQDDGTSSVSHHVDLSTEETETGIEDQICHLEAKIVDMENERAIDLEKESHMPDSSALSCGLEDGHDVCSEIAQKESDDHLLPLVGNAIDDASQNDDGSSLKSPVEIDISPEDERSLSISETLDSNCGISPEFARKMAPIAAEEDDEWTTVEDALAGATEEKLEATEENQEILYDEEGKDADGGQPHVGDGVCFKEKIADQINAGQDGITEDFVACAVLNPAVVTNTNPPEILIVLAENTVSDDGSSQTESDISSSSEKRTSKKKKTSTTNSTETSVKRTKKTKKSDEKENISVSEPNGPHTVNSEPQTESLSLISHSASASDADDLLNVSVREIMQTYCSEAAKSFGSKLMVEEIIPSPVPIQNLKARSMVDLCSSSCNQANTVASLRSNLFNSSSTHSRSTNNLACFDKTPVVTGVSVRALKTSFSKFDQLSKKTVIHVRSNDSSKAQKQFADAAVNEVSNNCKSCGKMVFQMEQIKAERAVWHKNCFRCKECNKQLTSDTYSSHEGVLFCKPHFKELFKPKAVVADDEPPRLRKPEMIIRENQPMELPPEVVRASDKPDLGLEELASLNVRSRFQVFEKGDESDEQEKADPGVVNVKRSPSILSKLAKFQKKGMDVGVTDDFLNGDPREQSPSSSEQEEDDNENTNRKVVKSKKLRERPISFGNMEEVKSVWSNGVAKTKEELREERKQEIQQIRSRLFMGKQVKMKEAYEQAVRESETTNSPRKNVESIRSEKARSIKECFEKGEPLNAEDDEGDETKDTKKNLPDDADVFEAGISKKSRSLFLELDKTAKNQEQIAPKPAPRTPSTPTKPREVTLRREPSQDIIRSSDMIEEVSVDSTAIGNKFKFFETYKVPEKEKKQFRITPPREGQVKAESPDREVINDPNVVRAADRVEPDIIRSNTTAKMLSLFRQLEERTEEVPDGPKPLKCFTPPPDYKEEEQTEESEEESEEEYEEEEEEDQTANPNLVRSSDKVEDDYLKQCANAARAKQLRAKFERWEEKEVQREQQELQDRRLNGSTANVSDVIDSSESVEVTSIECTKSLLARFESMRTDTTDQPKDKLPRPKVNRFVEIQNCTESLCEVCHSRVYPLERIETSGRIFHKSCFRCVQCKCLLRLETFTLNCGRLYCMPHFRQLFTVKGNYDEGFGVDQHKAKWSRVASIC